MGILWILAGVVVVTGAFFIPTGGDVWASLNSAGIAAGLFLIALLLFATRKPFPRSTRLALCSAFVLAGTTVFLCWTAGSRNSRSQTDWMVKIRTGISRNVLLDEMPSMLLEVMQRYYLQSPGSNRSIGELFRAMHQGVELGSNVHAPFLSDDSLMIYVAGLSEQEVILVGQEMCIQGRNREFRNFNGRSGMIQERAILTPEGMRYESEN